LFLIKYLHQRLPVDRRQCKTPMNGLFSTFFLKDYDSFFNNYKQNNVLAQEALTASEEFLPTLNEFFDLYEGLTDAENSEISWYNYTVASNKDYIRVKSVYYNEPSFSNVLINMSKEEAEDYNTYKGACFGKVRCSASMPLAILKASVMTCCSTAVKRVWW
jgi:hypothetical protein